MALALAPLPYCIVQYYIDLLIIDTGYKLVSGVKWRVIHVSFFFQVFLSRPVNHVVACFLNNEYWQIEFSLMGLSFVSVVLKHFLPLFIKVYSIDDLYPFSGKPIVIKKQIFDIVVTISEEIGVVRC